MMTRRRGRGGLTSVAHFAAKTRNYATMFVEDSRLVGVVARHSDRDRRGGPVPGVEPVYR